MRAPTIRRGLAVAAISASALVLQPTPAGAGDDVPPPPCDVEADVTAEAASVAALDATADVCVPECPPTSEAPEAAPALDVATIVLPCEPDPDPCECPEETTTTTAPDEEPTTTTTAPDEEPTTTTTAPDGPPDDTTPPPPGGDDPTTTIAGDPTTTVAPVVVETPPAQPVRATSSGELPRTGSTVAPWIAAGAGLLVVGAALVAAATRSLARR